MFATKPAKPGRGQTTTQSSSSSSKHRASKSVVSRSKRSFKDQIALSEKAKKLSFVDPETSSADSPIVTISVGRDGRLFACHEPVLCASPYFASLCRSQICESSVKRINLVDEMPEIFSSILEFLYKGDYYPRLILDKKRNSWTLEDIQKAGDCSTPISTILEPKANQVILKDTVIYCAAEKYGLEDLKSLALRKQGLQSRIQCSIILSSARFAYDNTPESDAKLRAHYLALIIRSRNTFKRSGTLQNHMEMGGKMFFDLFVAMCNHMDDISSITKSPR